MQRSHASMHRLHISAHYYADKHNSNNNISKFSCQLFSHSSSSKPKATGAQRRTEEKADKVVLMT